MKVKKCFIGLLIASALMLIFASKYNQSVFRGSRIKNPDCYIMDFEMMNGSDSHSIIMEGKEYFSVEFSIKKGIVNLVILDSTGKIIYRGNEIESGVFDLMIPSAGEYKIEIYAKHAKGYISIYVAGDN